MAAQTPVRKVSSRTSSRTSRRATSKPTRPPLWVRPFLAALNHLPRFSGSGWFAALTLLGALAGTFCLFFPSPPFGSAAQTAIVTAYGLLSPFALALLFVAGWFLLVRRRSLAGLLTAREWFGAGLCSIALLIGLGLWTPDWEVAGRSLQEVSAGGLLSHSISAAFVVAVRPAGAILLALALAITGVHLLLEWSVWQSLGVLMEGTGWIASGAAGLFRLISRQTRKWLQAARTPPIAPVIPPIEVRELLVSAEQLKAGVPAAPPPQPATLGTATLVAEPVPTKPTSASEWTLPGLDLLEKAPETENSIPVDAQFRRDQLEKALRSLGVDARVVEVHQGPAVTQFGIEPGWDIKTREVREREPNGRFKLDKDGRPRVRIEELSRTRVKVSRITGLANDLALAMAAPSIRIEAPVPGRPVVGIEVPNQLSVTVTLRGLMESNAFQKLLPRARLALALGKNVAGDAVVADLTKMPHLLIAGSTGSGKSVCLNSIVACLLAHYTPGDVRFLMVDPKRVELTPYNQVPHLLAPVVVDVEKVVGVLKWTIQEMDARYRRFAETGTRNIEGFNAYAEHHNEERLPYLVLVIDELADLMMVAPDEVERMLCRLAQLARATGIHLIVATQRPSVDVVTGLIKANFPTRISFAVASQVDSRTILDMPGAEKLLGRGDMLYLPTDSAKPHRLQGPFLSDAEIERLVAFWRGLRPPDYVADILNPPADAEGEEDPLMGEAMKVLSAYERVSTSLLQRKLRIGYNRAARLIEQFEEQGLVGLADANRSREVLWREAVTVEEPEVAPA